MNLNDYEKKYFPIYKTFAETVCFILEKSLLSVENLPRPHVLQCRAKGIDSLRHRLAEADKLDTQALDLDRRDLAGVRLIFYTNNDVERFLNSSLIRENFEVEDDSTKIHHPTPDNEGAQYRAIHYTVRLRQDRLRLPEYARFTDLRCEIQIQTILNHAWSETSHDILYKDKLGDGYGGKAMKGIQKRFERIMDKYLIQAGYEIQKAQQEYERITQGKELFDRGIANLLDNAQNNNERYEILSGLRDYAIPNYDDLAPVYEGLKGPLLRTVNAARGAEHVPIETTYGNIEGFKDDKVTRLVVEIVESLRYVDVSGTLQLLVDIYKDEQNKNVRKQILDTVKKLAEYKINIYNQVGLMLQMELVDYLAGMSDAEMDKIWPIAVAIWTEAIQSDITETKWKAYSVVLSKGAIPVSYQLREVRDKAIKALFAVFDRSTDDTQRLEVLSALDVATRVPNQSQYSNELLVVTIKDATRIVDFVTERSKSVSYELLQHLEHRFLNDYFRAKNLVEDTENRFDSQVEAETLVDAIIKFRNTINADDQFVKYKVLVGFESVFPGHWTDKKFSYQKVNEYRRKKANLYIGEINTANENDWFNLIERCAETKSNDLATFPDFANFISQLAERNPEVTDRFLEKASDDLCNFIVSFLEGLALSARRDIYNRILEGELEAAKNLTGVARHLRYSDVKKPEFATRVLQRAIEMDDSIAVIECFLFALVHYGTEKVADANTFIRDALTFLNDRKNSHWVSGAWFQKNERKFYEELTPENTALILQNLGYVSEVNYQTEHILGWIAERQPEAVWDYFGARLIREVEVDEDKERFEAVPFEFHTLEKDLSKDPQLAIRKGLSWFVRDRKLFQYRGGRLLSNTFPNYPSEFAEVLAELVTSGGDTEASFALEIFQNYQGEISTFVILKEIVSRFSDDISKISSVESAIDRTGVVSGEFGFAEALQGKKESMIEWLTDERPAVKEFAQKHIAELSLRIASAHCRADTEKEMRIRSYDEEDESGDINRKEDASAD